MQLSKIKTIRTNNFNDKQVMEKIIDMWKSASNQLLEHKGDVYGLYHEYESDYKGDYSLAVAIESVAEDSVTITEDINFKIFAVDMDDEQGIFHTWQRIWELEEKGELDRAYTYDFEKYKHDGDIEIHIAIK